MKLKNRKMKKLIILSLVLLSMYACIKKDALKYDPKLVGEWVSNEDNVRTWLNINSDGQGYYYTIGGESDASGEVKYSLFEKKMWIVKRKFKVSKWLTGRTDGIDTVRTTVRTTGKDTIYKIDMKMVLQTTGIFSGRSITLYRLWQTP